MLSEEDLLAGAQADISDLDERALLADEREPKQEMKEETEYDGDDLYDAAIEPSGINEKRESVDSVNIAATTAPSNVNQTPVRTGSSSNLSSGSSRRFQLYVGNLTWWTTDEDLTSAIKSYGVEDILDIRFAENRQNGQSRGFATITVGSEASGKVIMDRLPGLQMHGNLISVLPFNKNSLQRLEDAAKGSAPQDKKDDKSNIPNLGTVRIGQGVPMNMMNRQMQMGPMNGMNAMPPLMGFQNQMQMRPNNLMQQQPIMQGPPSLIQGMQQGNMMMQNRMFSGGQQMNRMPQTNYPPPGVSQEVPPAEFEEIMSRNRTVSTSAITRAMNDAAAGDISGAVETLQTAISLIRQSKVSNSDACRNLIKTLEDALNSVESKEYSSRKHRRRDSSRSPARRDRSRESRSRERSRESRSHRHSHKRSRAY